MTTPQRSPGSRPSGDRGSVPPDGFRTLCRRRRCCPEVRLDASPGAAWAAILVERGGGERAPGEIRLDRDEVFELVRALDEAGFIDAARAEVGGAPAAAAGGAAP